jgi:hexokinase
MGKGFLASHGLLGEDLGDLIQQACSRRHLNVQLNAIVNDSSATLLSKAYTTPPTPYGLILGTGVNIAVHLPVSIISPEKFGVRPSSWTAAATHVIVNTELGMFGKGILPMTRWDVQLNAAHALPDFQPLEHLVGGRYLGEIARLILLDAIQRANAFDGVVPPSLEEPYSLDTEVLAKILSYVTSFPSLLPEQLKFPR